MFISGEGLVTKAESLQVKDLFEIYCSCTIGVREARVAQSV
jgi:hypothetical protein